MAEKLFIIDQPKVGDTSQYNFPDGYSSTPIVYEDSISLPENNDKFQEKDLHTTTYGSKINEVIIENNMKFSGSSFITIDDIKVDNSGVNYKVKNIRIKAFLFDANSFNGKLSGVRPENATYNQLNDVLNDGTDEFCFYNKTFSRRGAKQGLGNIDDIEGVEIVTRFAPQIVSGNPEFNDDLPGGQDYVITEAFTTSSNNPPINTKIIDDQDNNEIYFAIWMRGDARRWFGTDRRKKRIQVYKINNLELFTDESDPQGKITKLNWEGGVADNTRTGGGGRGGAEAAAFKVTTFNVSINTLGGDSNEGIDSNILEKYSAKVQPPFPFFLNDVDTSLFLQINPAQQLNNSYLAADTSPSIIFTNYFVQTTFGVTDLSGNQNEVDLQSYYPNNTFESFQASAPATVQFYLNYFLENPFFAPFYSDTGEIIIEQGDLFPLEEIETAFGGDLVPSSVIATDFIYFVIDWDDVNDEIKTLEDFLNNRPDNLLTLRELKSQGLYNTDVSKMKHTYLTPGIKTIKFITISYNSDTNELGRWKLGKARIYLDIPISAASDFGEVGGNDYTTIPWPHTTLVIGGVDENSNYKTSVQNSLSSGNIGNTDIIDERSLINDLENDELGKSIKKMDLEQFRYFNKSYNIYDLLNISAVRNNNFIPYDDLFYNGDTNKFPTKSSVGQIFINDNQDNDLKQSCKLELNTGELSGKSIYDSSGNSNKGLLIGDYKVKKTRKGEPMRRDSFIKVPKKGNTKGAL